MSAITIEEARECGLTPGNVSSIANYYSSREKALKIILERTSNRKDRIEVKALLGRISSLFLHFSAMARELRTEA